MIRLWRVQSCGAIFADIGCGIMGSAGNRRGVKRGIWRGAKGACHNGWRIVVEGLGQWGEAWSGSAGLNCPGDLLKYRTRISQEMRRGCKQRFVSMALRPNRGAVRTLQILRICILQRFLGKLAKLTVIDLLTFCVHMGTNPALRRLVSDGT